MTNKTKRLLKRAGEMMDYIIIYVFLPLCFVIIGWASFNI